ncbi:DUF1254 domain-containing protein [Streptacidiphilus fuscans]|uniref:DUF1254 domain-containing protein n=1 Tax=Streptacidiphilus fuscans TaxID=2789292 RepID=A0A931BAL0_9ACTN|nr:DUF1254 domain-containing protein [Streptacidiphilus fuscans]MBF9071712.1 DUF1254 domain-containing protein [Streptacidiphilus fuscans]
MAFPPVEEIRRTAAEGWIWGYALLENYHVLYRQAVEGGVGFGVFHHETAPSGPDGPPSAWAWLDLRAEPWVLTVPATERGYVVAVHDLDTSYVGFVGSGSTGGEGGHHLITGPGWQGRVPDGVTGVLRADTTLVGLTGRTQPVGGEDGAEAVYTAFRRGFRIRPLSDYLGRGTPEPAPEPAWPIWREEAMDTVEFFAVLDFLLGFCPVLPLEAVLRERLAALGVGTEGEFEPGDLTAGAEQAFEHGIADAHQRLAAAKSARGPDSLLFGTRAELAENPLARAVGASVGLHTLPSYAWF